MVEKRREEGEEEEEKLKKKSRRKNKNDETSRRQPPPPAMAAWPLGNVSTHYSTLVNYSANCALNSKVRHTMVYLLWFTLIHVSTVRPSAALITMAVHILLRMQLPLSCAYLVRPLS